jgi:hypothetical protein
MARGALVAYTEGNKIKEIVCILQIESAQRKFMEEMNKFEKVGFDSGCYATPGEMATHMSCQENLMLRSIGI